MKHLSRRRRRRQSTRARRAGLSVATVAVALGLVMSVFASPSLAEELEAVNDAAAEAPRPTLEECRTTFERTDRVEEDCAPHRQRLLLEQRAAERRAAQEQAAQEQAAQEQAAQEQAAQREAEQREAEQATAEEPVVALAEPEDCDPLEEVYNPLTQECEPIVPPVDPPEDCTPPQVPDGDGGCVDPEPEPCPPGQEDFNGDGPGCGTPPPPEDCTPPQVPDGDGGCVDPEPEPCPPGQQDFNGDGPGCGLPPVDPGDDGDGDDDGNGNGNGNGNTGNGGNPGTGATAGEQIGSVSGTPEGVGSVVTQCGGSAVCQAVAPETVTTTSGSSTEGLPDTGAPKDNGLALAGLALLLAGGYLVRPRRGAGRHRLVA